MPGYRDGIAKAMAVVRQRHYPRSITVRTSYCHDAHDHDCIEYMADCLEDITICNACGTAACRELPPLEALLNEAANAT